MKFSLTPFRGEGKGPDLEIGGSVERHVDRLSVRCAITGDLAELAIPEPETFPARKDRLWEGTCLEVFLGVKGSKRYWEFNFSPAGHWNVYRFESYREGMREEPALSSLPFEVRRKPAAIYFFLELEIGKLIPANSPVEIAVAAVIRTAMGDTGHWALVHAGTRPDFHRRDCFNLEFAAE
ncbi:MAG: DOMON-like domain-containing protein [Deltaproteobacteria bacterium]